MTIKTSDKTSEPILREVHNSRMRAAFAVASLLTCGLAIVPWIIWEIVKPK